MKICFDACVVVDILGATPDLKDSFVAYDVTCIRGWEPCIAISAIGGIVHILGLSKMKPRLEARSAVGTLSQLFKMIGLSAADAMEAHESAMSDYEDAEVAYSAYRAGVDVIVTRNKRNFVKSPVPAMTPAEFVAAYQPDDYEYDLVEF